MGYISGWKTVGGCGVIEEIQNLREEKERLESRLQEIRGYF